jgi:hypothetical protein
VAEEELRAREMELCGGEAKVYTMGGADKYYYKWWAAPPEKRQEWREDRQLDIVLK